MTPFPSKAMYCTLHLVTLKDMENHQDEHK